MGKTFHNQNWTARSKLSSPIWLILLLFLSATVQASEKTVFANPVGHISKKKPAKKSASKQQYKAKKGHTNPLRLGNSSNNSNHSREFVFQNNHQATPLIESALQFQGIIYKMGGQSPLTGFDCSGYVRFVFQEGLGYTLPRSAAEMAQIGHTIEPPNLKAGDLVFFNTRKRPNSHVGIYLGNNEFIHAPRKGARVRINSLDEQYWSNSFEVAKRYIADKNQLINARE